ncbi:hypothetical protein ACLOJK_009166 [Asimina triloba]
MGDMFGGGTGPSYFVIEWAMAELTRHPKAMQKLQEESIQAVNIDGYHIPAKTWVLINAWGIARDPISWESPEEFQPERFLSSSYSHIDFEGNDYELLPFGAGRRGCPGIHFAIATIELVLANLVYHFTREMPSGMSLEDLDMTESSGLTVHKKKALLLLPRDAYMAVLN